MPRFSIRTIGIGAVVLLLVGTLSAVKVFRGGPNRAEPASTPPSSPSHTATSTGTTSPGTTPGTTPAPPLASPLGVDPRPAIVALLAQRVGFAKDVTGGDGGRLVHVTTPADDVDNPPAGSLRAALSQPGKAWVIFDGDYTIQLAGGLQVSSDKTIDGRGRRVTITGHGQPGLLVTNQSNVIIENLIFTDFGDTALSGKNDTPDAINITSSTGVWIDHSTLSKAGDKLISVQDGSSGITVSWNRFLDQDQTIQLGAQANREADVHMRVTLHHNFFDRTGYRNPVVSYGWAHSFNNYLLGWRQYGARSERNAQLVLENNVFSTDNNKPATLVKPAGDGCNDAKTRCDKRPGFIKLTGNLTLAGPAPKASQPDQVFDPARYYPYRAEPASAPLAAEISAGAGWQPAD
ncbi:MAG: polysaccharide lyase family 1 protein [Acidimicrobiales bacterium]